MNNVAHTPGKWTAGCDREDIEEANVILAGDIVIARVEDAAEIRSRRNRGKIEKPGSTAGPDALDEADANARIMAAAPLMLDELEAVAEWMERIALPALGDDTDGGQFLLASIHKTIDCAKNGQ